jgi:hypothetical protein
MKTVSVALLLALAVFTSVGIAQANDDSTDWLIRINSIQAD